MGKIAVTLQQALAQRAREGTRGGTSARPLAQGASWAVADILCTFGPRDQPFEERHAGVCIAMVVAGSFGYRSATGRALLTPGALLLGNPGDCFECGHRHAPGDRCIAFHYAPAYFERLAAAAGLSEFYFLRTFQRVTGVTPHQYLLRARLRAAALRLRDDSAKVVDIALDCGFNDLSNFNHAFRAEFASSPLAWRARGRARRT